MTDAPALNTRPATGAVTAPLVLLEGEEKSGKSWKIAELSASPKVGRLVWMDLGEGAGDEYAAVDGASYEVIVHDGTYRSILDQVRAARAEAQRRTDAGELPLVLAVDSLTHLWDMCKDWIDDRARRRDKFVKKLRDDPEAEPELTTDLWNDATARWRGVMTLLMTFPGPVIVTARGKEAAEIKAGKPTGDTTWRVEGQKNLGYDVSVWIRMTRQDGAKVIGARSVHLGVKPGDPPAPLPSDWSLEGLIFDDLRYQPGPVRDLVATGAAVERRAAGEDLRERVLAAGSTDELRDLWNEAKHRGHLDDEVTGADEHDETITVRALINARVAGFSAGPRAVPDNGERAA